MANTLNCAKTKAVCQIYNCNLAYDGETKKDGAKHITSMLQVAEFTEGWWETQSYIWPVNVIWHMSITLKYETD